MIDSMIQESEFEERRSSYWLTRVNTILNNYFDQLENPKPPHPEFIDLVVMSVDCLMSIAYQVNALDSCLILSKINLVLKETEINKLIWTKFQAELLQLRSDLNEAWDREAEFRDGLKEDSQKKTVDMDYLNDRVVDNSTGETAKSKSADQGGNTAEIIGLENHSEIDEKYNGTFEYVMDIYGEFDSELIGTYLSETSEQISTAEQLLLALESDSRNVKIIINLFRILHTIKGNAGLLGLHEFMRLTHSMEQYLEPVRENPRLADKISMDLLLKGIDTLNSLQINLSRRIENIENNQDGSDYPPVSWANLLEHFDEVWEVQGN